MAGAAVRLSPSFAVLISIFTVTPNLRPVSQKVRSASQTLGNPGPGTHLPGATWPGALPPTGLPSRTQSPANLIPSSFDLWSGFWPVALSPLGDQGEVCGTEGG